MLIGRFPQIGDRLLCINVKNNFPMNGSLTKGKIYVVDPNISKSHWPCVIDDSGTARNKYLWETDSFGDFKNLFGSSSSEEEE